MNADEVVKAADDPEAVSLSISQVSVRGITQRRRRALHHGRWRYVNDKPTVGQGEWVSPRAIVFSRHAGERLVEKPRGSGSLTEANISLMMCYLCTSMLHLHRILT